MSALNPEASRRCFRVGPDDVGADGQLNAAALLWRAIEFAAGLLNGSFEAVAIHELQTTGTVRLGDELAFTAALEPRATSATTSLVVRRVATGRVGDVVMLGSLQFSQRRAEAQAPARALRGIGALRLTPVEATFRAAPVGGAIARWLTETALVSVQGCTRSSARLDRLLGLTTFGAVRCGQALRLRCSVVGLTGARATVLTELFDASSSTELLGAITEWVLTPR